ncbi:probable proteasome inhibitor [Lotus japonicus]|uniref:probable proteasome inhibitor n=1 Tax=Lotus japonicus TaxID=34305 RepID=UPI00258D3D4C|nr:probable proteasome inhibitor [Lotus japonicus]
MSYDKPLKYATNEPLNRLRKNKSKCYLSFGVSALSDPSNDGEYVFVYAAADPEIKEKKNVLVKCLAMNDKLVVHALRLGDSEPLYLQINAGEDGGSNYAEQHFKDLEKLLKRIDSEILSKLLGWPPPPCCPIPHSPPPLYPRWFSGGGGFRGGLPVVPPPLAPSVPGFEPNRFARNPPRC